MRLRCDLGRFIASFRARWLHFIVSTHYSFHPLYYRFIRLHKIVYIDACSKQASEASLIILGLTNPSTKRQLSSNSKGKPVPHPLRCSIPTVVFPSQRILSHGLASRGMAVLSERFPDPLTVMMQPISPPNLQQRLRVLKNICRDFDHSEAEAVESGRHLLQVIKESATVKSEGMTGAEISNVMWSLAFTGHYDREVFDCLMEVRWRRGTICNENTCLLEACILDLIEEKRVEFFQALYGKLNELDSHGLVNVLWALAASGSYNHEVFASLNEFVWDHVHELTPRQAAVTSAAFAMYSHFDDDDDLFNALSSTFCG